MTTLTELEQVSASSEFYDALELLCVKYGASVALTVVIGPDELKVVNQQLARRKLHSQLSGELLVVEALPT